MEQSRRGEQFVIGHTSADVLLEPIIDEPPRAAQRPLQGYVLIAHVRAG